MPQRDRLEAKVSTLDELLILSSLWAPGPLAWAIHENASYVAIDTVCNSGHTFVLHAITMLCLALVLIGMWHAQRLASRDGGDEQPDYVGRRFSAICGLMLCAFSILGILLSSVPSLVLDACARAS